VTVVNKLGELLVNTGDFMEAYFTEACDTVMKFREFKIVKKTVITILPRLAALSPEAFSKAYLNSCINYLTAMIKAKEPKAYISLGEIAVAVKGNIRPYLDPLVGLIRMGFQAKKKGEFSNEALTCLSMVAVAVGPALRSYMQDILPEMLNGGLSENLTESMAVLGQRI
jgi:FKBP12-rapamycin complex-associated protein